MFRGRILSWTLVIVWMGLIFFLSSQPGTQSGALSKGITQIIVTAIERVFPGVELDVQTFHSFVRKSAHFVVYLVLGFLVMNAIWGRVKGIRRRILLAVLICVLYAVVDEVYQASVPGRSGEVMDVIIDSAGAVVGIAAYLTFARIRYRKRRSKEELNPNPDCAEASQE